MLDLPLEEETTGMWSHDRKYTENDCTEISGHAAATGYVADRGWHAAIYALNAVPSSVIESVSTSS